MRLRHVQDGLSLIIAMVLLTAAVPSRDGTMDRPVAPEVRLSVTATLENGEPVGASESFRADVGEVYAVLEVEDAPGETLWVVFGYLGSESLVEVHIQDDPDRQWARMAIPTEATGEWSVAVVHEGETLATRLFTVGS